MANAARGPKGRFVPKPDTAERDAEACRLRTRGLSLQQIADELGFADPSNARRAIQRALKLIVQEPAEEVRQLELARLDVMWQHALRVLEDTHLAVSMGKVVRRKAMVPVLDAAGEQIVDPMTGQPMTERRTVDVHDDSATLAALQTMLKIQERRAKLLGLDAPAKKRIEVVTTDEFVEHMNELTSQIEAQEARVARRQQAQG